MVPNGAAGAATAGAATAGAAADGAVTGRADWLSNIVPKSAADAGLRVFTGSSDLRRIAGAVYVGCVAVLNVGMK
jgi:hypothetical protein